MKLLNKINGVSLATAAYLSTQLPAFAQGSINLCPDGELGNLCTQAGNEQSFVANVLRLLLLVAILVALVFLIWGGIKWITSGGDKAKVEGARNTIIGAIIGLVVVFLAWFILGVIGQLFGVGDLKEINLPNLLSS